MTFEKLSTDNEGTYKDEKTEQVFTVKDLKKSIADQKTAFDYFKKVEYPQGAKKDVIAAIDYYNEWYIGAGVSLAQFNVDKNKLILQEISKIDPSIADYLYSV